MSTASSPGRQQPLGALSQARPRSTTVAGRAPDDADHQRSVVDGVLERTQTPPRTGGNLAACRIVTVTGAATAVLMAAPSPVADGTRLGQRGDSRCHHQGHGVDGADLSERRGRAQPGDEGDPAHPEPSRDVEDGRQAGTSPASTPAGRPHTMSGPATGTASTLAGTATTGTPPNAATRIGATPTCAATVTAMASRSERGPGNRADSGAPSTAMPAVAPTDSHQPTDQTSSGSTRIIAGHRQARGRERCWPVEPRTTDVAATAAIAAARRTDGSNRVSSANHATTASVAT